MGDNAVGATGSRPAVDPETASAGVAPSDWGMTDSDPVGLGGFEHELASAPRTRRLRSIITR
jgi:hypothetical protein